MWPGGVPPLKGFYSLVGGLQCGLEPARLSPTLLKTHVSGGWTIHVTRVPILWLL